MNDKPTPKDIAEVKEVYDAAAPMVLRDYFAGQAMIGLLAQLANPAESTVGTRGFRDFARDAYELADAMLEARVAGTSGGNR